MCKKFFQVASDISLIFAWMADPIKLLQHKVARVSAVDCGGAGGARAPPEFGGLEKGQSLISAYRSFAITTNTPGYKKLSTVLSSSTLSKN